MWLSLKIQEKPIAGNDSVVGAGLKPAPTLLISVPKKTVRLATRRNRLKRLIREAFRKKNDLEMGKAYIFQVKQNPGDPGLKEVQEVMDRLVVPIQ